MYCTNYFLNKFAIILRIKHNVHDKNIKALLQFIRYFICDLYLFLMINWSFKIVMVL